MENPPVDISLGPDPCPAPPAFDSGIWGAEAVFYGRVRGEEDGKPITGIEYSAYGPMAVREMERIAAGLQEKHGPHPVRIHHRTGFVPNGEASLLIAVAGRHSAGTFALCAEYLRLIKESVPVWKRPL